METAKVSGASWPSPSPSPGFDQVRFYSRLHLFWMNRSLQAVRYVDRQMASKSCSPVTQRRADLIITTPPTLQLLLSSGLTITHRAPRRAACPPPPPMAGRPSLGGAAPPPPSPSCAQESRTRVKRSLASPTSPTLSLPLQVCESSEETAANAGAEVGKLWPGGHMWPGELFNLACRAFTRISPNAKSKRLPA